MAACRTNTIELLNARFANGKPTSHLHHAGVLMRAYDGDIERQPPSDIGWIARGPHSSGDIASASIVNARAPYAYAGGGLGDVGGVGMMGVLLSPAAAHAALACSYARDGHTVMVHCLAGTTGDHCVPGCVGMRVRGMATPSTLTFNRWCEKNISTDIDHPAGPFAKPSLCAWRPADVQSAMEAHEHWTSNALRDCPRGGGGDNTTMAAPSPWCACLQQRPCCSFPACPMYNELILHAAPLEAAITRANASLVEAVYYFEPPEGTFSGLPPTSATSQKSFNGAKAAARALHHRLVEGGSDPCGVPLLISVNLMRTQPFRLAPARADVTRRRHARSLEEEEEEESAASWRWPVVAARRASQAKPACTPSQRPPPPATTIAIDHARPAPSCAVVQWRHLVHCGGTSIRHAFERLELSIGTTRFMAVGRDLDSRQRELIPRACVRCGPQRCGGAMVYARAEALREVAQCVRRGEGDQQARSWSLEYHIDAYEKASASLSADVQRMTALLASLARSRPPAGVPAVLTVLRVVVVRAPLAWMRSIYAHPEGGFTGNSYNRSRWAPGLASRNATAFAIGQGGGVQWSALVARSGWVKSPKDDDNATMHAVLGRFDVVGVVERLPEVLLHVCERVRLPRCPILGRDHAARTMTTLNWPASLDDNELARLVGTTDLRLHALAAERLDATLRPTAETTQSNDRQRYFNASRIAAKPRPAASKCPETSVQALLPFVWMVSDENTSETTRTKGFLHRCIARRSSNKTLSD